MKASYLNILLTLVLKYLAFFVLLAFFDNRFKSIVIDNAENQKELFFNSLQYLFYIIIVGVGFAFPFSIPFYFSMHIKNKYLFIILFLTTLVTEYFAYTYMASENDKINGVYNEVISILFFLVTYWKIVLSKFRKTLD